MIELETIAKLVGRHYWSHISVFAKQEYTDTIKSICSTPLLSFQGRFAYIGRTGLHAHRLAFLTVLSPQSPRQSDDKGPAFASPGLRDR